nr:Transposase InsN for insertion sequence element IS911 [Escherichia coli]
MPAFEWVHVQLHQQKGMISLSPPTICNSAADAAKAMDVGLSTMTRWVKQLRDERQGKTPKASPITPEQIEIRELRKKLQRIEMENEILKKATVDSIGQRNSYVKTWGCGGFLNETNIYSRGKSLCF